MTNVIKVEHKTAKTDDDTHGKQPMTIRGRRQDMTHNKTKSMSLNRRSGHYFTDPVGFVL